MGSLTGKTAVVVGASGTENFGTAIARKFAAEGAHVVVSARRLEPLKALAAEIGGKAVACDVTQEDSIAALFKEASEATGSVDIAVFSAGIHAPVAIAELTVDTIQPSLDVSFIGVLEEQQRADEAHVEARLGGVDRPLRHGDRGVGGGGKNRRIAAARGLTRRL